MPLKRDYIGPDPIQWLTRLIDVAKDSQFSLSEKDKIDDALRELRTTLILDRKR